MLQAGIETLLTLRQLDILPNSLSAYAKEFLMYIFICIFAYTRFTIKGESLMQNKEP